MEGLPLTAGGRGEMIFTDSPSLLYQKRHQSAMGNEEELRDLPEA